MKILIAYYSDTGNTEKVAKAIKEGISGHEVDLLSVKEVDPENFTSYDLIFLGSGIYGFNVSRKLTSLIKKAPQIPLKFAYFYTHESLASWPKAFDSVNKIIEKSNCQVLGEYDCCGENLVENAEEQRLAFLSRLSLEERKKVEENFFKFVKGHPDAEDLNKAKLFAKSILNQI